MRVRRLARRQAGDHRQFARPFLDLRFAHFAQARSVIENLAWLVCGLI
jgi:hypothetical protein